MRRLFSFLSTKFFWVLLGLISISLLIWFFGPIIAIGNYKPLESSLVRALIIAAIFGIWIGKKLLDRYIQSRRNKELVDEIKSSQEPILKHVKKESSISQQFEEIDTVLKSAKFSKSNNFLTKHFSTGQYLYEMPWYVVMGAAGTGKTTILRESGLNFPLESSFGASISGLAGTKDCDWFLTDDAVLLDTAGRLSLHDNGEEDTFDWLEFINLLKKYRPIQPINGVIVTVGTDDLLSADTDFKNLTMELRKRIHEMRAKFGINFPVYLIVTKVDVLKGFNEFFSKLSDEEIDKSFGFTIPSDLNDDEDNAETVGYVNKHLGEIRENIEASYLNIIDTLETKEEKNAVFAFSNEFSLLNKKLVQLYKELHKSSKFEDSIQWRGIFFTSATQSGDNLDPVFENLVSNFKITPKYIANQDSDPKNTKSYFINELFSDVIFNEANLAGNDKSWSQRDRLIKGLGIGLLAGAGIILSAYIFNSYLTNKEYLSNVNVKANDIDTELKDVNETRDLLQAVGLASKIKDIPQTLPFLDIENPSLEHRMGLYQGGFVKEISESAYNRALRDRVMPLISYKIDDLLRSSVDNTSIDTYNSLKAYLMLYDETRYDSEFILNWLLKNFEKTSSIQNEEQKQEVIQALRFILEDEGLTPSLPLDTQLVDQKRQAIARNDISVMILNDTFLEISDKEVKPVSFDTMGGKQSRLIFSRASGKPLTEGISPIYTKQAYIEMVLPELLKSTAKLYEEEDWVLGSYSSLKTSQKDTLDEAKRAYFRRYISTWNNYISDIRLKQPVNLRESRDVAKILSDTNSSPLKNLIQGISENTKLSLKDEFDSKTEGLDNSFVDRVIARAGFSGVKSDIDNIQDNYISTLKFNTPVDDEFAEFHLLTAQSNGSEPVINEVILSIKDLYEYLDILSIAVDKGVELPSNDSLYKYRAEVNRLPSPFRQMFDRFSVYVLNESLEEMNNRIERAQLEEAALEQKRKDEEEQKKRELEQKEEEQQEEQALAMVELKKKQRTDAIQSMKSDIKPITEFCRSSISNSYPFDRMADNEVALSDFSKLFSNNGMYATFANLSPEIKSLTERNSFNDLITNDPQFGSEFGDVLKVETITNSYFSDNDVGFDFDLKFTNLNPDIDKVVLNYGGKNYQYSHGPIIPYKLQWPIKSKSGVSLSFYANNERIKSITKKGEWALFKLLDSANSVTNSDSKTLVRYQVNDKELVMELTPKNFANPFNLSGMRRFRCP